MPDLYGCPGWSTVYDGVFDKIVGWKRRRLNRDLAGDLMLTSPRVIVWQNDRTYRRLTTMAEIPKRPPYEHCHTRLHVQRVAVQFESSDGPGGRDTWWKNPEMLGKDGTHGFKEEE